MQDLEKERDELIKLMEKSIDPELMKKIEIANRSIISKEQQHEVIVTTEGTINA